MCTPTSTTIPPPTTCPASDVPAAQRTPLRVLRTDSRTFADMVEARRNRRDDFYKRPAGHIDLCNIPLPVR